MSKMPGDWVSQISTDAEPHCTPQWWIRIGAVSKVADQMVTDARLHLLQQLQTHVGLVLELRIVSR